MALLRAYFDASGGGGLYAVGGFVGREADWIALEKEWRDALQMFGLPDFHLADIVHEFGHERGGECIGYFSRIVGDSKIEGIGSSCNVSDWLPFSNGKESPYFYCFESVLKLLQQHLELEMPGDLVAVVVDHDVKPWTRRMKYLKHTKHNPARLLCRLPWVIVIKSRGFNVPT